ncbi:hypothetical protein GCM10023322_74370 [Rugosimonospora acidiphila]|uniref:Peptidase S11 D-alanyl-D-alanine carboxypeptidase A N-terminal domain-containing protein n=1 Tax=Rugosimonospora acidiphila TaxID=556531 RepID=A0ABP9SQD2_9ACTN
MPPRDGGGRRPAPRPAVYVPRRGDAPADPEPADHDWAEPEPTAPDWVEPEWAGRPVGDPAGGHRRGLAIAALALAVLAAGGTTALATRRPHDTASWTPGRSRPIAHARQLAQAAPSPLPSPSPSPTPAAVPPPATYTVPGAAPAVPWPATGQATLRVVGVGRLGATPGQHPVPIASVTKVMTAYVVLRDHPLSAGGDGPTLTVTAAEAAAYPDEVAKNESLVRVAAGEVLTERQALDALLLPSADNIALILARWDAGDVPRFLAKMNATAAGLGMTSTHYTDPSGYEASTRSTADDQTLLAARAMRIPAFARIVAQRSAAVPLAGTVRNYNTLLGSDGVDGIKTGSTSAAGGCLLFAAHARVAGQDLTIVGAVLGQPGTTMYGLPQALAASRALIQAAQRTVGPHPLIPAGQAIATVGGVRLAAAATVTVIGWPGLTWRTRLHAAAHPVPGAGAGTLELDGAESHQSVALTALP